jgi:hypothetical protein
MELRRGSGQIGGLTDRTFPPFSLNYVQRSERVFEKIERSHRLYTSNSGFVDITGGLSLHALIECIHLWDRLQQISLTPGTADRFIWKWAPSQGYSSHTAYRAFFHGRIRLDGANVLWKTKAPGKCKFFSWLALHGRCWTSDRLRRHNMPNSGLCAFCEQEDETIQHLLMQCPFSREVWCMVLRAAGLQRQTPGLASTIPDWWMSLRSRIPKDGRRGFDTLVVLVLWSLWKARNDIVFQRKTSTVLEVCAKIREEGQSWVIGGMPRLAPLLGSPGAPS